MKWRITAGLLSCPTARKRRFLLRSEGSGFFRQNWVHGGKFAFNMKEGCQLTPTHEFLADNGEKCWCCGKADGGIFEPRFNIIDVREKHSPACSFFLLQLRGKNGKKIGGPCNFKITSPSIAKGSLGDPLGKWDIYQLNVLQRIQT